MLLSLFALSLACGSKNMPAEAAKSIEPPTEKPAVSPEIDPTKASGILTPHILHTNLTHDYASVEAPLTLRARKLIIDDSGVVPKHTHDSRLGYAYIISGEITEYREGTEPLTRKTGDFITEEIGITHYWHNRSGSPVRAIVFDILPPEIDLEATPSREPILDGLKENSGIREVTILNTLSLDATYPELKGRVLRARMFTLDPDAVIGQHRHQERSGYVYVVSGEIVEIRNDIDKALTRRAGDVILEENGVQHYWENKSGAEVQLLSVDIFAPPAAE